MSLRATQSPAADASIAALLARLEEASTAELKVLWRAHHFHLHRAPVAPGARLGSPAGGAGGEGARPGAAEGGRAEGCGARPAEAVTGLKAPPVPVGTRLMRDWGGATHEVIMLAEGVLWRGRTWSSLSVVAREITGSPRNGPRFFGLRSPA